MKPMALLFAALLLAPVRSAAGQSDGSALCWHARPEPQCRLLLLTDFGAYFDLPGQSGLPSGHLVADWGLMLNVTPRDAVGASFFASVDKNAGFESGPAVRYRRWIGERGAMDFAAGVGSLSGNNLSGSLVYGLVKYSPEHWIGIAVRPELVRRPGDVSRLRVSGGVEVGWVPGVLVPALGVLVGVIALLAHPPSL